MPTPGSHISGAARESSLASRRQLFLADPFAFYEEGLPRLSTKSYPLNIKFVDAQAAGGGNGTQALPWTRDEYQSNRQTDMRVVCRGGFFETSIVASDRNTFDFRGWGGIGTTGSIGKKYVYADSHPNIIPVGGNVYYATDAAQDWSSSFVGLSVRQATVRAGQWWNYAGLSRESCNDAGYVQIYDGVYNGQAGTVVGDNGKLEVGSAYKLEVGQVMAYTPDLTASKAYPATVGSMTMQIPLYVVYASAVGASLFHGDTGAASGVQTIKLSLSSGGAAIEWTAGDIIALKTYQGVVPPGDGYGYTGCPLLFTTHDNHLTGTGIPTPTTLAAEEMAYAPHLTRMYFKTTTPLQTGDEVIFNSSQGTFFNCSGKVDVHTIGGTFVGNHVAIDLRTFSDSCVTWAPNIIGASIGVAVRTGSIRSGSAFAFGSRVKYTLCAQDAEGGVTYHTDYVVHKYFSFTNLSDKHYMLGDRKAVLVNPLSDTSDISDGYLRDCGCGSFGGFAVPANQIVPAFATFNLISCDTANNFVIKRTYLDNCFGTHIKTQGDDQGKPAGMGEVRGWRAEYCTLDNRASPGQTYKGWCSFLMGMATGKASVIDARALGNLFLLGNIAKLVEASSTGRVEGAGVMCILSKSSKGVGLTMTGSTVYSRLADNGLDSVLYNIQDLTNGSFPVDGPIQFSTDYNTYCCPGVDWLAVFAAAGGAGAAWSNETNIKLQIPMPTSVGAVTPWACGQYMNDGNSVVLDETAMEKKLREWDAGGWYIGAQATLVPSPGWTLRRSA